MPIFVGVSELGVSAGFRGIRGSLAVAEVPYRCQATIRARKQVDGSTRYTSVIRIRRGQAIALRTAAISWAKHREVALEDPSALIRVQQGAPTLADLIRGYIETFETISKWQRSKQAHPEFLERRLECVSH